MPMRWLPRLALALTALLVLSAAAMGQGTRPPIKIGLLLPYTGVIAVNGQETTRGIEFFLSKIGNKAGGREIQLLKEDDEAKPDVGQTKIRKLVERTRWTSSSARSTAASRWPFAITSTRRAFR